ncbi:AmmeMemoRadiSam system protein A [Sulfurimonas sp.]
MSKTLITHSEKSSLKKIAKLALDEAVINNHKLNLDTTNVPDIFMEHFGAFVTLHKDKKLRGCIGQFEPTQPLYQVIIDMTVAASRYDSRFSPVTKEELNAIDIEISILTPRVKVNSVDDIVIGKHGIYVEYGSKNGTYLPQVATDMGWNAKEFFKSCCEEKAGIYPKDCQNATIYVYEAIVF